MGKHERPAKSDEWYTPRFIFEALGETFDLDVCAPSTIVPSSAFCLRGINGSSLTEPWAGFVWMNPPFGGRNGIAPWLAKFFEHRNGIALTADRTSAPWWQEYANKADAILFISPKVKFIPGPGVKASSPAQGTTLFAAGRRARASLERASAAGLGLYLEPSV